MQSNNKVKHHLEATLLPVDNLYNSKVVYLPFPEAESSLESQSQACSDPINTRPSGSACQVFKSNYKQSYAKNFKVKWLPWQLLLPNFYKTKYHKFFH